MKLTASEAEARMTLLFSKEDGIWQIVAFQNTKVAAGIGAGTV
jgi:hypothetical protein